MILGRTADELVDIIMKVLSRELERGLISLPINLCFLVRKFIDVSIPLRIGVAV